MKWIRTNKKKNRPQPISKKDYRDDLLNVPSNNHINKAENAFNRAWDTRNFEIDLYWRRTNYFWAFQIPVFGAYLALITSDNEFPQVVVYLMCCIGIIISLAWKLINVGSKSWQRHWEHHIDHLEDEFTGPLYKTITETKTFSVSKINELVSLFFMITWIALALFYLYDNKMLCFFCKNTKFIWKEFIITFITIVIIWQMVFEHGLGLFQDRTVTFYRRKSDIN